MTNPSILVYEKLFNIGAQHMMLKAYVGNETAIIEAWSNDSDEPGLELAHTEIEPIKNHNTFCRALEAEGYMRVTHEERKIVA